MEPLFYVTDSRTLRAAGPMNHADAVAWLESACRDHGKDKNAWQNPLAWSGLESMPLMYTESDYLELMAIESDE